MRGKRTGTAVCLTLGGNIPAYAGKTVRSYSSRCYHAEHPRVCGENWKPANENSRLPGTSPRMRGKRTLVRGQVGPLRNIPAYAGKTTLPVSSTDPGAEHPRVCGENVLVVMPPPPRGGTSPRMRGKRRGNPEVPRRPRNIPAYAGKTRYFTMLGV